MSLIKSFVSKLLKPQKHIQSDEQNELKVRLFCRGLDLRTANRIAQFMFGADIALTANERAQAIALLGGTL